MVVQQAGAHGGSYDRVYQIHERLHMMVNYVSEKSLYEYCHRGNYNTHDLGSAGIGSVQK